MRRNAFLLHGVNQHRRVNVAGILFACGENIGHQNFVGEVAAVDVILEQRFYAGIGVRLHHGKEALVRLVDRIFQGAVHLCRVVTVIRVQLDAADRARIFKPAMRRGKAGEGFADGFRKRTGLDTCRHGRKRMQNVEFARNAQMDMRHGLAFKAEVKFRAAGFVINEVQRTPLVRVAHAVGHRAAMLLFQKLCDAGIVAVADADAVFRQKRRETGEGVRDVVNVLVEVEVILFDVGHDGNRRVELKETRVEFARFHNECVMSADAGASADIIELSADVNGRVKARVEQHFGNHGRRCRLAVRAADVDGVAIALHQLTQQCCAFHLGNAQLGGAGAFGVIRRDGGGIDDNVRAVHILGTLTDVNMNARLLQRVGHIGTGGIRTGHANTELDEHAGKPAHGAAADADHVCAFARIIFDMRHSAPPLR